MNNTIPFEERKGCSPDDVQTSKICATVVLPHSWGQLRVHELREVHVSCIHKYAYSSISRVQLLSWLMSHVHHGDLWIGLVCEEKFRLAAQASEGKTCTGWGEREPIPILA